MKKLLLVLLISSQCYSQSIVAKWNPLFYANSTTITTTPTWYTWGNPPSCPLGFYDFKPTLSLIYGISYVNSNNQCAINIPWVASYTLNGTTLEIIGLTSDLAGTYEIQLLSATQLIIRKQINTNPGILYQYIWLVKESSLNINNLPDKQIVVYPNPVTNNQIYIESKNSSTKHVTIFNLTGQKILEIDLSGETLRLDNLKNGIYLMRVTSPQEEFITKLIIQ